MSRQNVLRLMTVVSLLETSAFCLFFKEAP
jgi:hypothetical protein